MSQDKAQPAVSGPVPNKGCNAVLAHLRVSLRAQREAVINRVASLGKGLAELVSRNVPSQWLG